MTDILIEVAIALPSRQTVISLTVAAGTTARAAAVQSGLNTQYPDIDIASARLGIYGHLLDDPEHYLLKDGDRVEIYRPLIMDPKEARRQRARQSRLQTRPAQ